MQSLVILVAAGRAPKMRQCADQQCNQDGSADLEKSH
jgi:hypothetical protein